MSVNYKRPWCISFDEYFMGVAVLTSQRSKDPSTQVGSCIVSPSNRIVSTGYNGMPNGCHDDEMPWGKNLPQPLNNKYLYVVCSEMNAIMNRHSTDLTNCKIYVTLFPCCKCAKLIIQSGITQVIYLDDKYHYKTETQASKIMFEKAGIKVKKYKPSNLVLKIGHIESKL
ncbi:hypothetical protein ACF0H5_010464 [Mactra antiquata]